MVGRLGDAQVVLNAWQADCPHDAEPHLRRGRIREHELADDAAEAEYRLAIEKDPGYPPALYALARLLVDRRTPRKPCRCIKRVRGWRRRQAPRRMSEKRLACARWARWTKRGASCRAYSRGTPRNAPQPTGVGQTVEGDPAAFELGKLESIDRRFAEAERWLRQVVDKNGAAIRSAPTPCRWPCAAWVAWTKPSGRART